MNDQVESCQNDMNVQYGGMKFPDYSLTFPG